MDILLHKFLTKIVREYIQSFNFTRTLFLVFIFIKMFESLINEFLRYKISVD